MQDNPFSHDANSLLYRGEIALNADHLVSEGVFCGPDFDDSVSRVGFHAPDDGSSRANMPNGRFSFQNPKSRKLLLSVPNASHRVAKVKSVTVFGYPKVPFYAFDSSFNRQPQARNIRSH
jgi:hypothetical protein